MGVPKAALPWPLSSASVDPQPLHWPEDLQHQALRTLRSTCVAFGTAGGSARASAGTQSGPGESIPDALESAGPLSAIAGCLGRAHELRLTGTLVLACDMPFVSRDELEPLAAALCDGADVAMWTVGGVDQPLCAGYSVRSRPHALAALGSGARRVVALLGAKGVDGEPLRVERFVADEKSALRLVNLNTRRDYDRALARLRSGLSGAQSGPEPRP